LISEGLDPGQTVLLARPGRVVEGTRVDVELRTPLAAQPASPQANAEQTERQVQP
jgi:hypothetical protein